MPPQRTTKKKSDPQLSKPASKCNTSNDSDKENASNSTKKNNGASLDLEFITMPRPMWDFHREHEPEEIEAMSKAEVDKLQKEYNDQSKKHFKGDPKKFPDHPWVISKTALDMYGDMDVAFQKRDVEAMGMYFYNDTFGYGIGEVINIHFLSFAKEFKKAKPSIGKLWSHIEAFAWLFGYHSDDVSGTWGHIDDGEGVGETVSIICQAILATLNELEKEKLWNSVPNLSLILSIYFTLFPDFEDAFDCVDDESVKNYPAMIRAFAEKHDMVIEGVHGIKAYLTDFEVSDLKDEQLGLVQKSPVKDKFNFKQKWQKFQKSHIPEATVKGQLIYDVTKMSKKERIAHAYDKKDPLASMPPAPSSGIY